MANLLLVERYHLLPNTMSDRLSGLVANEHGLWMDVGDQHQSSWLRPHACSQMQVTVGPKTSNSTVPPVRVQSSIKPGVQTSELMSSGLHVQVSLGPKTLHWHVRPLGS